MKKNKMMRLASAMMVMTLMTTSVISGTFAKYVTSDKANDSARVAKWGVKVEAEFDGSNGAATLFNTSYATDAAWDGDDADKVSVLSTEKVVAPGTSGTMVDFTVTGTPEVDVEVTYTADLTLANWTVNSVVYCPVIITVNGDDYKVGDTVGEKTIQTTADLEKVVEDLIVASAKKYNAGTDLGDAANVAKDLEVSWRWPFETGETPAEKAANNVKDTALGDAATKATIKLDVSCTVTQID